MWRSDDTFEYIAFATFLRVSRGSIDILDAPKMVTIVACRDADDCTAFACCVGAMRHVTPASLCRTATAQGANCVVMDKDNDLAVFCCQVCSGVWCVDAAATSRAVVLDG